MTTLGEILARLSDRDEILSLLAESGDLEALAGFAAQTASERDASDAVIEAVNAFTARASDEDWIKLMGRLQGASSPAAACLAEMMAWSLAASGTACSEHG